ncbi:hypothetical protein REPUB_Repub19eG0058700 [Reevesia pubescens]
MLLKYTESVGSAPSSYSHKWRDYGGAVFLVLDPETDKTLVIKMCVFRHLPNSLDREVTFLTKFPHDNVVRLLKVDHGHYDRRRRIYYLAFEYLRSDLRQFIGPKSAGSPILIKKFLHQMLLGVAHCHSHGILHRHLEPKYMLLDLDSEIVKISEFGEAMESRFKPNSYKRVENVTWGYTAPEIHLTSSFYSTASDIWSLGVIFTEMLKGNRLFNHIYHEQAELVSIFGLLGGPTEENWPGVSTLYDGISEFQFEPKDLYEEFPNVERTGVELLSEMLKLDPAQRISAEDALKHQYFSDL